MIVHYVTAAPAFAAKDPMTGERPRQDLAKFFSHAAAASHVDSLGQAWADARVEERDESESEQHPAHRSES